eukprot:GFYU01010264.1.p1 GENE.GFYU01010264.1~~GFYU01010264.1.p1  ORF type:complete len:318 (+),score=72.00 GFYU01010264.1:93-1046(+)
MTALSPTESDLYLSLNESLVEDAPSNKQTAAAATTSKVSRNRFVAALVTLVAGVATVAFVASLSIGGTSSSSAVDTSSALNANVMPNGFVAPPPGKTLEDMGYTVTIRAKEPIHRADDDMEDSVELFENQNFLDARKTSRAKLRGEDKKNITLDDLIVVGKMAWEVVEDGKPSLGHKDESASVVPKGTEWQDMAGWKPTKWTEFEYVVKNKLGFEVARFEWAFIWFGEGNYNDHGKYIGQASVSPGLIQLAWMWNLNSIVKVGEPYNTGTKEDPIAAVTIELNIDLSTYMYAEKYKCTVVVQGDTSGQIMDCRQFES